MACSSALEAYLGHASCQLSGSSQAHTVLVLLASFHVGIISSSFKNHFPSERHSDDPLPNRGDAVHWCHHCTCVHFRRALESQAKTVFSHFTPLRVALISTLRTHATSVAEQVAAHFVNPRFAARANCVATEDTCLFRAVAGREEIY